MMRIIAEIVIKNAHPKRSVEGEFVCVLWARSGVRKMEDYVFLVIGVVMTAIVREIRNAIYLAGFVDDLFGLVDIFWK